MVGPFAFAHGRARSGSPTMTLRPPPPRVELVPLDDLRPAPANPRARRVSAPAASGPDAEKQRDVAVVGRHGSSATRPLARREVRNLAHRVDAESDRSQAVDVLGDRSMLRPGR